MSDIKNVTLPIPSDEYDLTNESTTRRTIEQAIQSMNNKMDRLQRMQESITSKSLRRHQFLLMGAKND
jgi:hypothetical protein